MARGDPVGATRWGAAVVAGAVCPPALPPGARTREEAPMRIAVTGTSTGPGFATSLGLEAR